jgi:hypothetical protein
MCTACCKPTEFAVFGRNVEACTKSFGVNPLMYLKGMGQECKSAKQQKWKREAPGQKNVTKGGWRIFVVTGRRQRVQQ